MLKSLSKLATATLFLVAIMYSTAHGQRNKFYCSEESAFCYQNGGYAFTIQWADCQDGDCPCRCWYTWGSSFTWCTL